MTDNVKESAAASKVNLLDFDLEGLTAWCAGIGEKAFRATQLSRWLHRHVEGDFDNMTNLAKVFRAKLKDMAEVRPPVPITEKKSADGTRKWLFDVGNGNAVESVFIPEDDRGTLCISTQAGCAMGCLFCSTGKQGFNRNLTTAEIVGQLWWAERELRRDAGVTDPNDRIISNVVLMGMGEPLQNLDNVLRALHVFLDDNGYGLSRRRVTVSTSGLVRQMDKLAEDSPVALAVSLHAGNDALRDKLIAGLSKIPHSALNGDPVNRLPGNVSFCFEGVEGESLLLLLDAKGICASSGGACTSGSLDPSHVLLAIGRPHDVARGSLRLSLCEWNTDEEIDRILDAVPEVVEYLRGMSPLWKDLVSGKKPFTL